MPSLHSDLYATIKNRLSDVLNIGDNGAVADPVKEYANRAQRRLWQESDWDALIKESALTIATGNLASVPLDFGREVTMYQDTNGDGKPDFFYYKDGRARGGYKVVNTFVKSGTGAGNTLKFQFYQAPASTVYLRYMVKLDDFTGSGDEYSFFPADLVVITAQMIHMTEAGIDPNQLQAIKDERQRQINIYRAEALNNNQDTAREIKDASGNTVIMDTPLLDGSSNDQVGAYPSSYDHG
jgi:hypothetical protein